MTQPLRRAAAGDAPALAALARRSFSETFGHLYAPDDLAAFLCRHTPEAWAAEIADPRFAVLVAEAEGKLVAYLKLGPKTLPVEADGSVTELRQFYVLGPWQGLGLAPTMMDWALAEARGRGSDCMLLSVFVDNPRAQRFYARYGFERVGSYTFMVGSHADEDHIMRLAL